MLPAIQPLPTICSFWCLHRLRPGVEAAQEVLVELNRAMHKANKSRHHVRAAALPHLAVEAARTICMHVSVRASVCKACSSCAQLPCCQLLVQLIQRLFHHTFTSL